MIAVSYRLLKMLGTNISIKLGNFAQNLYMGYSQVQRDTFLCVVYFRVLTLTILHLGSLRASVTSPI